jgi:hypothetical protein
MTTEQATNLLIQAVVVAQERGVYNIADAKAVIEAITTLKPDFFKGNVDPEEAQNVEEM